MVYCIATLLYFRKDFYIEVPELAKMTDAEVEDYRAEMDHIKGRETYGSGYERFYLPTNKSSYRTVPTVLCWLIDSCSVHYLLYNVNADPYHGLFKSKLVPVRYGT